MAYKDLVPIGTALIIGATSFALGAIYGNSPYDFHTLWVPEKDGFERSLAHYKLWGETPMRIHHILHGVIFLGLTGCFIKLYKPHPEIKFFEYGTLGLIMLSIIVYLTNLRVGAASSVAGDWGEVDPYTGVNVMAASQFMMVVVLVGVLVLQGGLYYAQWYEEKIQRDFLKKHAKAARTSDAAPEAVAEPTEAVASGAQAKKSKAKKRA